MSDRHDGLLGQRVTILAHGSYRASRYTVVWNGYDATGRDVGSGVYLLRMETPGAQVLRRVTLVR